MWQFCQQNFRKRSFGLRLERVPTQEIEKNKEETSPTQYDTKNTPKKLIFNSKTNNIHHRDPSD